jgi:alkylation response protein AidB-like acyl-CoA dehydrogenase
MDLTESADQVLLREAARKLLENECTSGLVRTLGSPESDGHDPGLWRKLADAGWLGLAFPEDHGGGGASFFDLACFSREAGRVLLPTTFASTVFAALVVQHLGTDEQRSDHLRRMGARRSIATVALLEAAVLHDWSRLTTEATAQPDGGWELSGVKLFVPNAHLADLVVVVATVDGSLGAFLVDEFPTGAVRMRSLATFGGDRQSEICIDRLRVPRSALLGGTERLDRARADLEHVVDLATALQCMEMAGGAERVVEMTATYVSERVQFGRPIGSFQAVQHHVANMGTLAQGGLFLAQQAAWLLSEGRPARREVSQAKAWLSAAYPEITMLAHQVHGGMGYVRESDLHLYSGRAKATSASFGTRDHHIARLAEVIVT